MNPTVAGIMGTFQIVWVYYGVLIDSIPVIVWNIIAVVINFLVVGAFLLCPQRENKQAQNEAAVGEEPMPATW